MRACFGRLFTSSLREAHTRQSTSNSGGTPIEGWPAVKRWRAARKRRRSGVGARPRIDKGRRDNQDGMEQRCGGVDRKPKIELKQYLKFGREHIIDRKI